MVTDSIADSLIRIKNGYLASRRDVTLSYSKLVLNLCNLLQKEGYIATCEKLVDRSLKVTLKYDGRTPSLTDIKRVSKPVLRVYKGVKQLPRVLNGLGIAVISTPKGLMTDKQAK